MNTGFAREPFFDKSLKTSAINALWSVCDAVLALGFIASLLCNFYRLIVHANLGFNYGCVLLDILCVLILLVSRVNGTTNGHMIGSWLRTKQGYSPRFWFALGTAILLVTSASFKIDQLPGASKTLVDAKLRSWLSADHSYLVLNGVAAQPDDVLTNPLRPNIVRVNTGYTVYIRAFATTKDGQKVSALLTASFAIPEKNRKAAAIGSAYAKLTDETVGGQLAEIMRNSFSTTVQNLTVADLNGRLMSFRANVGNTISGGLHDAHSEFSWDGDATIHVDELNPNFDSKD